jgi:hypothetical protein
LDAQLRSGVKATFIVFHFTRGLVATCATFEEAEALAKKLGAPPHFAAIGSQSSNGRWMIVEARRPRRKS